MATFVSSIIGAAVFVGFIMLVGNPSSIETIIGLFLGLATTLGLYLKLRRKH